MVKFLIYNKSKIKFQQLRVLYKLIKKLTLDYF